MNGRQVSQVFKTLFLEAFLVFVKLDVRDAFFPAYAADVAEFFGQFERLKALVHDFGFCFP
mgnify:CR=1 FL=1